MNSTTVETLVMSFRYFSDVCYFMVGVLSVVRDTEWCFGKGMSGGSAFPVRYFWLFRREKHQWVSTPARSSIERNGPISRVRTAFSSNERNAARTSTENTWRGREGRHGASAGTTKRVCADVGDQTGFFAGCAMAHYVARSFRQDANDEYLYNFRTAVLLGRVANTHARVTRLRLKTRVLTSVMQSNGPNMVSRFPHHDGIDISSGVGRI